MGVMASGHSTTGTSVTLSGLTKYSMLWLYLNTIKKVNNNLHNNLSVNLVDRGGLLK